MRGPLLASIRVLVSRLLRISLLCLPALWLLAGPASSASADQQTYTYKVPVSVDGYQVQQTVNGPLPHPQVPGGYITHMEVDIVDADGTPVPIQRLMLHHIVFLDLARKDNTCSNFLGFDNRTVYNSTGERFYAAGEERAQLNLPPGYGYKIGPNDPWGMVYMLMNHRSVPDSAFIQYKVTINDDPNTIPVKPYWLDVANCQQDPVYTVPGTGKPGATNTRSYDFTMPESGRIVAGGGHVHGGAEKLTLTEPDCNNREVAESDPTWGLPSNPFYHVTPILHEPGPINMTAFTTPTGIPIAAGERIRLNSIYDDTLPHVRVMGISVIYVAPDNNITQACGPLPTDETTFGPTQPGRPGPIPFRIPLTRVNGNGTIQYVKGPPGLNKRLSSGSTIQVGDRFFSQPNVTVKKGSRLNWQFSGLELHNLTLANGPVGIATPNLDQGRIFSRQLNRPGTYRFFCALHPTQMQERVIVLPAPKKHHKRPRHGKHH
jgi:plastocyanin